MDLFALRVTAANHDTNTLFGWAYFGILATRSWNPNQMPSFCPGLWVKRFFLKPHYNGA
jgi:hypothetical protein